MTREEKKLSDTGVFEAPSPQYASRVPPLARVQVDLASLSDRGKKRLNNEDHFLALDFGRFMTCLQSNLPSGAVPTKFEQRGYGFAVADGMGGEAGGEVASGLAITTLVELALETPDWIMAQDEPLIDEVERRTAQRLEQTSEVLEAESRRNPELRGMGTTMTLAISLGDQLLVAHIGDSRAYLFRDGRLLRLTRDHTFAQALADSGVIPLADVARHRLRNMLTRCLGGPDSAEAEFRRVTLQNGDRLLLCSDGLTELVDDEGIGNVLSQHSSSIEACRALVDWALDAGGTDNVTVVLAGYTIEK
jgi:serine/threonine protein phosphatase PrpC